MPSPLITLLANLLILSLGIRRMHVDRDSRSSNRGHIPAIPAPCTIQQCSSCIEHNAVPLIRYAHRQRCFCVAKIRRLRPVADRVGQLVSWS